MLNFDLQKTWKTSEPSRFLILHCTNQILEVTEDVDANWVMKTTSLFFTLEINMWGDISLLNILGMHNKYLPILVIFKFIDIRYLIVHAHFLYFYI